MKRLITFTFIFALVCCTSCKEKKPDDGKGTDTTSVTPTVKKYVIGSYYNENGVQGIVYKVDAEGLHGMLVSLDESNLAWAIDAVTATIQTDASDADDGKKNVEKIKAKGIENYPAFKWCDDKKGEWYLPASNELSDLCMLYQSLQDSLAAYQGVKLDGTSNYWSSQEKFNAGGMDSKKYAEAYAVSAANFTGIEKIRALKVRAICSF